MAATSSPTSRRLPSLAKYDVIEELGHGGMATVYRAHDKRLSRDVAVKVIHPHLRDSKEVQSRFFVEAKAVAKLRHPNIVEVFDVSGEGESEQYLVVELLRGKTLRKLLQDGRAIPPEVAAALALELLAALGHAHGAGVVHRDVKPENVILEHRSIHTPSPPAAPPADGSSVPPTRPPPSSAPPGERIVVKLTDFGIAKLLDAQGVTSTGQVLGSPAHMAPEQIEGGEVDPRADVFGLGVLLYECMVGHLPFQGNNPAQVLRRVLDGVYAPAERERAEVGKNWSKLVDRALARRADDRFASAGEMRDAILAELKRVGVASPRAELEAWFDAPDAYAEEHKKQMIAKLCELGASERRAGDALAAAADYNRALAYAPDDPQLMRIVGGMHRAESRARLARRVIPALAGAVALGVVAFFVTRAVRERTAPPPAPAGSVEIARADRPAPAASTEPAPPSSAAGATSAPSAAVAVAPPPSPPRASAMPSPPADVHRTVTLAKVRPFGVVVAVDGDPATEAETGKTLTLNDKPHTLVFTCKEDLCEPLTRAVAAGADDASVEAELKIKPAKLTVVGDPTKSYLLEEKGLSLQANAPIDVPMRGKNETFHVKDLLTGKRVQVTLTAGKADKAVFADEP